MTSSNTYIDIYTNLGFLFYSVAAVDGTVRPAEAEKLKAVVAEKWLPLEDSRDAFGTDAAHYIGMSFDLAAAEEWNGQEAYTRFLENYTELQKHFQPSMRQLVLDTAAAVANAFNGTNKAELTRLTQIQQLLSA